MACMYITNPTLQTLQTGPPIIKPPLKKNIKKLELKPFPPSPPPTQEWKGGVEKGPAKKCVKISMTAL